MKTLFKPSFFRDVKKSPTELHPDLETVLQKTESVKSLKDISNLKKLKGHSTAYRIKIKTYRLCFYFEDDVITFARFLPRKDVYRSFP